MERRGSRAAREAATESAAYSAPESRRCPRRHWILVVDDDPVTGRSTSRLIQSRTHAVVHLARDWASVRELVEGEPEGPRAIVMDYQLGGRVSGLGVLSALRRIGHDAPCAFLTGAADKLRIALRRRAQTLRPQPHGPMIFSRSDGIDGLLEWLEDEAVAA